MDISSSKIKKIIIFQEMDISRSKIKKFLIFHEMELCSFKIEKFLVLLEMNFPASHFSYISGRKFSSLKNKKTPL